MKQQIGFTAALCIVFAGFCCAAPGPATAQEQASGATPPPNVLVIQREFLKPGKAGSPHENTERAFVQLSAQANSAHYLAMDSLSGRSRALFLFGYNSFADWQKDQQTLRSTPALAQAFDNALQADGELLTSSSDAGVFVYQPDKSVGPPVNIGAFKYMEITVLKIRPGHGQDWDELAKLHNSIFSKAPNAGWAMYEKWFGTGTEDEYIALHAMRSLAEIDETRVANKKIWAAVSADQKKKVADLEASTFESIQSNLFVFDPKMSYAADSWKSADPGFWGQQ